MRHFNPTITKILEDINMDEIGTSNKLETQDKALLANVIKKFREGKIDKDRAGSLIRNTITQTKENKPLAVVADFVDILNQSSKSGNTINGAAIRKLARVLGVKEGALDDLKDKDRALALQLIQHDLKNEASGGSTIKPKPVK